MKTSLIKTISFIPFLLSCNETFNPNFGKEIEEVEIVEEEEIEDEDITEEDIWSKGIGAMKAYYALKAAAEEQMKEYESLGYKVEWYYGSPMKITCPDGQVEFDYSWSVMY